VSAILSRAEVNRKLKIEIAVGKKINVTHGLDRVKPVILEVCDVLRVC